MTKDDLAQRLDKAAYPFTVPSALAALAQAAGLVIVYGASDDLMELRGAIEEEVGAFEGTEILVTQEGLFQEDGCPEHCPYWEAARAEARKRGQTITAVWHDDESPCWTYTTTIPHTTFEIVEDNEPYCLGIVFALKDVERA